jgi:hypothetical protein
MTDLEKLKALLTSWGVPFNREGPSEADTTSFLIVGSESEYYHTHPKITGYPGFYTSYTFDNEGKFVKMGAWE